MRARHLVYHLSCFKCLVCDKQLHTGDEFGLGKDAVIYCRDHYYYYMQQINQQSQQQPQTQQQFQLQQQQQQQHIIHDMDFKNEFKSDFKGNRYTVDIWELISISIVIFMIGFKA